MYAKGICLGLFITRNLLNIKPRKKFEPIHGYRRVFCKDVTVAFFVPPIQQYSKTLWGGRNRSSAAA